MQINTKVQAKTIVSALRREIKTLGKGPEQLSHTDCLNLTAKALGFTSWNAWEASLLDAAVEKPAATASKYPLVNNGDFDFVTSGEHGQAFSGFLVRLTGTSEMVFGSNGVDNVWRTEDRTLGSEYDSNGTDIDWDSQRTRKNLAGAEIWEDEDGNEYSGARLVIAPEGCDDPYEDEELPIRPGLIKAFLDYFADEAINAAALQGAYQDAVKVIGYKLTIKETDELRAQVEVLASRT